MDLFFKSALRVFGSNVHPRTQMKATIPAITKNAPLQLSRSMDSAKIGLIIKVPAPGPEAIIPVAKERR